MKKQIDGWAFLGDDGEWKMFHSDFGKVQYQMLEGKLGAGKIVEVRIVDVSDDSKDVVVPRELFERIRDVLMIDPSGWERCICAELNEILPEKEGDDD